MRRGREVGAEELAGASGESECAVLRKPPRPTTRKSAAKLTMGLRMPKRGSRAAARIPVRTAPRLQKVLSEARAEPA